jgi:hypothetical protein
MIRALEKCLDVSTTIAEINKRRDTRFSDRPQWKAENDLVELLDRLDIRDEAERDSSGYRSACHDAALLSELFGSAECRKNDSFDECASRGFGERLACLDVVKLD